MSCGYKMTRQLRRKAPGRAASPRGRHGAEARGETRQCNGRRTSPAATARSGLGPGPGAGYPDNTESDEHYKSFYPADKVSLVDSIG